MNSAFKLACLTSGNAGRNGALLAMVCARNVYEAIDRHSLEAGALVTWLIEHAAGLGLPETDIPGDDDRYRYNSSRRRGVGEPEWSKVGALLRRSDLRLSDTLDVPVEQWVDAMAPSLALDAVEADILRLALYYKVDRRIERLFDIVSECRSGRTQFHRDARLIALLLRLAPTEVELRLAVGSKLLASGLLKLERDGCLCILERLKSLIRQGTSPTANFYDQLLGASAGTPPLSWDSFAHLGREADIAVAVLQAALARRESGINLLLYGPPGTGKTSFAATLAERVGVQLRPVAEADQSGEEPNRDERLAGLRLAQRLVAPEKTLLLFDEMEDLFVTGNGAFRKPVTSSRVFIHRLLETMAVPVIWTANDISVLGPAVLRRMTLCLELKVPNLAMRTRLWCRMADAEGVVLPEADATRLARLVPAAPAVASAALRATRLAGGGADTARVIVEGVARAVHGGGLPAAEPDRDAGYDPALVNADCDLATLRDDLLRPGAPRAVSFLLSGPPGAGKSAWVRHLASRMGLPVLQKRASDLLDAFVGGTEHNIAAAFAEARDANAFLVFDEADSLLLERADAVRSWEISQVNEMLTWMEGHALPFACTTNLADRLDRASLRRFLMKVRFDWLTPAQARLAFPRFFGIPAPNGIDGLPTLTPADFALVRRRAAIRGGEADPGVLMRLLAAECEGRVGGKLPVGFGRASAA